MCGIAGIASRVPIPNPGIADTMRDTMNHRGPDDFGSWSSPDQRVALVHRRLAVIDLSPGASQPMADPTGRLRITYNGEIYNFKELRRDLEDRGYRFQTKSDTEVVLSAYREWGTGCLSRLNGMFAFALYDSESRRLFLARDRAGEKPLFYHHAGGKLTFASELKALMVDPDFPRTIDPSSLHQYLAYGFVPGNKCIVQGVRKLAAAQAMTYDPEKDELCTWSYWMLPNLLSGGPPDHGELIEELERLLLDSVRLRLVADVPVGILLSGGLDSSLVTAMAARASYGPVKTFTVTFPGFGGYDEGPHARLVAKAFGTEHTELTAEPASMDLLPALARQYDEPIGDHSIIPTYLVSRLIRDHATVALGGDGGDELFGGYPHYNLIQKLESIRRCLPAMVRGMAARTAVALLPVGTRGRNHLAALGGDMSRSISHINLYFDERMRDRLLSSGNRRVLPGEFTPERYKEVLCNPKDTAFQNAARVDFRTTLVDDYLVKLDRSSMLASLEIRAPFLDHRLVEFAFGRLPDVLRATSSERKILLRQLAAKLLPGELDLERKQGFELPLASWFRGEWGRYIESVLCREDDRIFDRKVVRELLEHQRMGFVNAKRLFLLSMFELWRREYRMTLPTDMGHCE